jgi:hypothetical protein
MSSDTKTSIGCCGLIALVVIAAVVYVVNLRNVGHSNYTKGHQAYQQMDCPSAIIFFDAIINHVNFFTRGTSDVVLAYQERDECVSFQAGIDKQQSGDFGGASLAYYDVIVKNQQSDNRNSPLVEAARNRVESVISESEPSALANQGVCDFIDAFLAQDLIPQRDTNLPMLYFACGQFYEESDAFASAIGMYEQFQSGYPNHSLSSEVEAALAHSIVENTKTGGAGVIASPERSGTTNDGSTIVIIKNDSPERLRIVFTGPENRIEELGACFSCPIYYTGYTPQACPETTPIGSYTLKPGQYEVVVESISDSGTTPWTGDWTLETSGEYSKCFFIVTVTKFMP